MSTQVVAKDLTKILSRLKREGKDLNSLVENEVHVAEVVRHGEKLIVPDNMTIPEAIETLQRRAEYENQKIGISRTFDFYYLDGAYALVKVLEEKFGWAEAKGEFFKGFFGPSGPSVKQIRLSASEVVNVPWGDFKVPGIPGTISAGLDHKNGQHVFMLSAEVPRMYEKQVNEIGDLIEKYVLENSIYKGKALRLNLDGESAHECGAMPDPEFMDLSDVKPDELIFSDEVQAAIETNVFTPIDKYDLIKEVGIPFKRGVLFAGTYGTGKTLAAMVAAYKATQAGITFIYCQSSDHIEKAIKFARQYGKAVIFCEDIDKALDGERDTDMDGILNVIDGIDSKNTEIMIVLTTNEVQRIDPAMIRPGRLDAVINVKAPDAKAVEKLVRLYGRGLVEDAADLRFVGQKLQGKIPAVIREAVERAKLSAIRLGNFVDGKLVLSAEALLDAANSMSMQLELLNVQKPKHESDLEKAANILVTGFGNSNGKSNGHASEVPPEVLPAMAMPLLSSKAE